MRIRAWIVNCDVCGRLRCSSPELQARALEACDRAGHHAWITL